MLGMTVCAVVFCAGAAVAQGQGSLTRDQYFKKVGESAMDKALLAATLEHVDLTDCTEFARRTLRAVTRMPLGPEEKSVRYIETAILCADRARDEDVQLSVVAEAIAHAPIVDLPGLVQELSKRFDPRVNNLTTERYRQFAEKGVRVCVARNARVDNTKVRNTFAVLLFTRSADVPGLQDALVALLPDESGRRLATTWLAAAANDDYTAILAAAEVLTTPSAPAINMAGYPQTARLLAYLSISDSALDAFAATGTGTGGPYSVEIQIDAGIQQTPLPKVDSIVGYQNQGIRLTRTN